MKVELRQYKEDDLEVLDKYVLSPQQQTYTSMPRQWMQHIFKEQILPVTIWYGEEAAGFFVLDVGNDRFNYSENEKSVLLRALSVNPNLQGKGIGTQAMMQVSAFAKENFPTCNEIIFGVNENNTAAYQLYLKCGFEDTGNKYLGGKNGPQFIMRKKIN